MRTCQKVNGEICKISLCGFKSHRSLHNQNSYKYNHFFIGSPIFIVMNVITIKCKSCNKNFDKFLGEYTRQCKKGNTNFFCSKECVLKHTKTIAIEQGKILKSKNESQYYLFPKKCPQCNIIIPYDLRVNTYCSKKCGAIYTQKDGGNCHWSDKDKMRISNQLIEYHKNNPVYRKTQSTSLKKYSVKICKVCKICNKSFDITNSYKEKKRICCSWECYKTLIKSGYLKGKSGGYRERGGRGKQGWYRGYYCHSTWELAWIMYQLDHGISFVRNKQGFEYVLNGEKHKFYPDFILDNGDYVEIKGWDNGQVEAKLSQFPYKLNVLRMNEMRPYIEYAKQKCGSSLENLYEKV